MHLRLGVGINFCDFGGGIGYINGMSAEDGHHWRYASRRILKIGELLTEL